MEDSKLQHSQNENAKRKRVKLVNKRHNVLARQETLRVLTQERTMPNESHAREKRRISRPDTWNAICYLPYWEFPNKILLYSTLLYTHTHNEMSLPVTSSFCSVGIGTGVLGIAGVTTSSCCCCAVQVLVVEHERHIDSPVSCPAGKRERAAASGFGLDRRSWTAGRRNSPRCREEEEEQG